MKKIIRYMNVMHDIKEYKEDKSPSDCLALFNHEVDMLVMDGWQPLGGLLVKPADEETYGYYYQTLVMYED